MTTSSTEQAHVYSSIVAITAALASRGIAKGRKAGGDGGAKWDFRGIDDVYNALAPLLAEHKLCILPQVLDRTVLERQSRGGGAMFYVTLRVSFDIVSAEDGSTHQVVTMGEAMDFSDKATNKAMSAAYKYMAWMLFCIPTLGVDSEVDTHQVEAKAPAKKPARNRQARPNIPDPLIDPNRYGQDLLVDITDAATRGSQYLISYWMDLSTADKRLVRSFYENPGDGCPEQLKSRAADADADIKNEEEIDLEKDYTTWSR